MTATAMAVAVSPPATPRAGIIRTVVNAPSGMTWTRALNKEFFRSSRAPSSWRVFSPSSW
jgi:hypothetical protein